MNDFVEQCRREWKRLGVQDSVAEEMATELAADLNEADADGIPARELLGNAATDPRSFAASWAAERAVLPRAGSTPRLPRRTLALAAIAALTIIAAVGAGLVLLASPQASAPQAANVVLLAAPPEATSIHLVAPPPSSPDRSAEVWIKGHDRVTVTPIGGPGVEIHTVGSILLIVGIAGIIVSLLLLLWSSRRNDWSGRGTPAGDVPARPA